MSRRFFKRKPRPTWRVVPARITPKQKIPDPIPRILRFYALVYTGKAPASESSTFISTLNQYLTRKELRITPRTLRTWERGNSLPEDELLSSLVRNAPPLSWPWLLAHDLLAANHPDHCKPQSLITHRILNSHKSKF